ncbi:MAG: diguanylate cyclase, partial [Anaerovorax sp.]
SGTKMAALAISYNLDTFDQILDITAFEGKGYAHIIRKDGTVVIRSSSPNALEMGYNILNSLAEDAVISKDSMAKIKTDIANGIHGQVEFTIGNHHEYMTYTPLDVQNWSLLTFVPVEVVNARSSLLLNITLLLCSMITILFTLLLGVLMFTFFRHKRKLEQLAYVDPITEGNTIERFYESAQKLLDMPGKPTYALVYTNIEKFKVLNEQFGRLACDQVLRGIEKGISKDLYSNECIGRLFADNFCILVTYTGEDVLCARFQQWHENAAAYLEAKGAIWLPLIMEFGVYIIENDTLP